MTTPSFNVNGREVALAGDDPNQSLLRWLRAARLPGTKEGCADGDCGACTVALLERDADGTPRWQAVNSCLLPLGALVGRTLLTVEALADGDALHPVQQALVDCAGSQCGYCTPGFVMSLFVAQQHGVHDDEAFEGNLCRCTGYQPIRAAQQQLAARPPDARWAPPAMAPLDAGELRGFYNPVTLEAALLLKQRHPDAGFVCGATDIGVELSHGKAVAPVLIALDRIPSLHVLEIADDAVRIGAAVTLSRIEHALAGVFPALDAMLPWFAARQVRNRATLGGNLGSASPIGDLLPILLALDATVELHGPQGTRRLPLDGYFLDYRRTQRAADEIIVALTLPRVAGRIDASYKVAKRRTDDISIVAAAFALTLDAQRRVAEVRLAYGGVAAVPRRARAVEDWLRGRTLDTGTRDEAQRRLHAEFSPLDDHRAGADYRRALCASLFAKFVDEHAA